MRERRKSSGNKNQCDYENKQDRTEKPQKLSLIYLLLLLVYLCLLGYLAYHLDDSMPDVITEKEAGTKSFSEERAWRYLKHIVGSGPRVAGTKYHLEKTKDLKDLLHDLRRNSTAQNVFVDWQVVSGDYRLEFKRPFVNVYNNVSNLVAILVGESGLNSDGSANSSILVNCHYDSVPTSPGASDNALFCAAMVEVLSLLSKENHKFKHNLIFLFNGAEENPLQGAHGFLSHPWSRGVTALVNLDSAGINCKSIVFQSSDPRVLSSYRSSVSVPSAQAFGEALFTSGVVPSDTDFRVFRDFAGIYGIDVAFSKYGQVYHTRFDSMDTLQAGVLQHSGDTLLALIRSMADDEIYRDKLQTPAQAVYWDYLTLFMVTYSVGAAFFIDYAVIVLALASVAYYVAVVGYRMSVVRELSVSVLSRAASVAGGCALLWTAAFLSTLTAPQLKYLSRSWIVVPMFWVPYAVAAFAVSQILDATRTGKIGLSPVRRFAQSLAAGRFILLLILSAMMLQPNTATMRYLISMPLLIMSVASFISLTVLKSCRLKAYQQCTLEVVFATPALLMCFVVAIKLNTLMAPIMARSPTMKPDFIVAAINNFVVILACFPLCGIEVMFPRARRWALITVIVCSAALCATASSMGGAVYGVTGSIPAPQRHYWFHTEVLTYDESQQQVDNHSGIWFSPTDVNTPVSVIQHAEHIGLPFKNVKKVDDDDCLKHSFCNMPVVMPRMFDTRDRYIWVDFDPPTRPAYKEEIVLLNKKCTEDICTMQFAVTGAPHSSVIVYPRHNISLSAWSLSSPVVHDYTQNDRPVYFMFVTRGTYTDDVQPYTFSVDFMVPQNVASSSPMLDITLISSRISHDEEFTSSYDTLVKSMPSYFNIATYLSRRINYVF